MASTLYDILEVIPTASPETIHAAYRSLISRNHPDKVAGLAPEIQAIANARTKEINHAYDILRDAVRRASYDQELREMESPPLQGWDFAPAPTASAAPTSISMPWGRRLRAAFCAAVAGAAAVLTLPYAANLMFGVVDFLLTGHARHFQDFVNSVDANGGYFGLRYLLVSWGWLFIGYLLGWISYRLGIGVGARIASDFGEPIDGTNDRLFLFLTFICAVVGRELLFSAHTLTDVLGDMFILAGAYRATRVTAFSTGIGPPRTRTESKSAFQG